MSDAAIAPGARSLLQLAASGVLLSALSFPLVLYAAREEPFFVFRWSDLVLIMGLGTLVCATFVGWGVACVRGYRRTARRGALAKLLVCSSVLWTAINLFYLGTAIYGYPQDLTNPNFGPFR